MKNDPERELRLATDSGNLDEMQRLIAAGADPNGADADGFVPLHYAMNSYPHQPDKDHLAAVRLLVAAGADVNAHSSNGQTPLSDAASVGLLEVVRHLHRQGAAVDTHLSGGDNALFAIADHLENRPRNYRVTITRDGRQVTLTDRDEIRAATGGHPDDEYDCYMEVVDYLIDAGISLDRRAIETGQTPLFSAAGTGCEGMVERILARGVNPNPRDRWGLSPLHYASRNGHLPAVEALLQGGADPNAAESYGFSPLHEAAENGHLEVVRALLAAGADQRAGLTRTYSPYEVGDTALDIARKAGRKPVVRFLEQVAVPDDRAVLERLEAALTRIGRELDAADHMRDHNPWPAINGHKELVRALTEELPDGFRQEHASLVAELSAKHGLEISWAIVRDQVRAILARPW